LFLQCSDCCSVSGSSDLRRTFDEGKSGALRLIKVAVKNGEIVLLKVQNKYYHFTAAQLVLLADC